MSPLPLFSGKRFRRPWMFIFTACLMVWILYDPILTSDRFSITRRTDSRFEPLSGPDPYHVPRRTISFIRRANKWHDGTAPQAGPVDFSRSHLTKNPNTTSEKESSLFYDFDRTGPGIAVLNQRAHGHAGVFRHPILELIDAAETKWNKRVASQSQTLSEAVHTYKARYKLDPPAGFDAWFSFAQKHGVVLVDEFDQMMQDILPHYALSPDEFSRRKADIDGSDHSYTFDIDVDANRIDLTGPRATNMRPKALRDMLAGMLREMPSGFRLRLSGSDHDTSSDVLGHDQREKAMELVQEGKFFTDAQLRSLEDPNRNNQWGWFKACSPKSAAVQEVDGHETKPGNDRGQRTWRIQTFIHDHLQSMDFCNHPWLKKYHGAMSLDYEARSKSRIKPAMVNSKFIQDSSLQITPLEAYHNFTEADLAKAVKWEDKTEDRLFWRGQSTGGFNRQLDWRLSHRLRLQLLLNGPSVRNVEARRKWLHMEHGGRYMTMLPQGKEGYEYKAFTYAQMAERYTDIGLVGKAIQCTGIQEVCDEIDENIDFAPRVPAEKFANYKYLLDVDGNGWSSRFHKLLTTGSVVLKMSAFPEWNMDWLVPWYHYVPIQVDYSDIYDVMMFFVGPIRENGSLNRDLNHEKLAQKIGENGQRFAMQNWRWEDMQAYVRSVSSMPLDQIRSC